MELIRPDDLRIAIGVKLTVASPAAKTAVGAATSHAREKLLDQIMSTLSGCVIVRPSPVGYQHGIFGLTEPHPFPDLADPLPAPCPKNGDRI